MKHRLRRVRLALAPKGIDRNRAGPELGPFGKFFRPSII